MQVQQGAVERGPSPLRKKVALFDTYAQDHKSKQDINPFSHQSVGSMAKRRFSKDEYGRPEKGSKSECRALLASLHIHKEMMELCKIIDKNGIKLFTDKEKQNDPRKAISFGELFDIYTTISDKLVGMLLRARKHKLIDFEGEVLFQRRDDHVPIILLKRIDDIKIMFEEKIAETERAIDESREIQESTKHSISDEETQQ